MNWSKNSSIELSRICVVLFMILLAALDIGCYWAVQWFVEIRLMYWQYGVLMMVTIYLCSGFGWVLLVRLWQLLQNIRYDRYVLPQSVRDKGMEARYRSAFELAGQAAAQLRDRGADESILCYLMLSGQTVPVLTTMNAGELYVFFRLRCCMRAQWEIRDAACQALAALREVSPELFRLYGPTCFCTGKCPEGKMTCGRQAEMKRKFSE